MEASAKDDLPALLKAIRREIREEYRRADAPPWIVGFSGGKDSTLVLQLVFEAMLSTPPAERRRRVYVACNDTQVESPVVTAYIERVLDQVRHGSEALDLPVEVRQTKPDADETFWVNLLGRGYPAPNRSFRWCTDRMKIRPTTRLLEELVSKGGAAILLLGARRAESAARARVVKRYSTAGELYNPHNDVKGCLVYRPIVDLNDEDVWAALLTSRAPWGGQHHDLVTLYRNARGGECPFVTTSDDAPSCGTSAARFGCWTCTVVEKDNSLAGLIDAGFDHLEPLFAFRNRLKEISATPGYRSKIRRTGQMGLGPLTFEARKLLLDELLAIQEDTGLPLISDDEVRRIRSWWERDEITHAVREAKAVEAWVQTGGE